MQRVILLSSVTWANWHSTSFVYHQHLLKLLFHGSLVHAKRSWDFQLLYGKNQTHALVCGPLSGGNLVAWLSKKSCSSVQTNEGFLCMQGEELLTEASKLLKKDEELKLNISGGWASRLRKQHNLKMCRVPGWSFEHRRRCTSWCSSDNYVKNRRIQDVWYMEPWWIRPFFW